VRDTSSGDAVHTSEFVEVGDPHFKSSIPSPWEHAEVAEIRSGTLGERIVAVLILWSEQAELRVVCKRLLLDGRPLPSDSST